VEKAKECSTEKRAHRELKYARFSSTEVFYKGVYHMFDKILHESKKLQPELVEVRRHIHRYPELGFEERETAGFICEKLSGLGLEIKEGVAGTGVVALLKTGNGRKTVALRADMDALPVDEQTDVPYKSVKPGIMHACGHDAHVAMLIGAANILSVLRKQLKVDVKFIFQPCEEKPRGGAEPMIEAGVLKNPDVRAIFGLHVNPYLPAGFVGLKEDTVMAAADEFSIEIIGKGGHGAAPHQAVDPILVASYVVQGLQAIVSRQVDPIEPVVVSVCSINGGRSFNVIADRVILSGTVRTLESSIQQQMPERLRKIVKGITEAFGADFNLDYRWGYPALKNDKNVLNMVRQAANGIIGKQRVLAVPGPSMGAEDFACFACQVPGAYFFLGVMPPAGDIYPWHNPRFDIDESALSVGSALLAGCAFQAGEQLED